MLEAPLPSITELLGLWNFFGAWLWLIRILLPASFLEGFLWKVVFVGAMKVGFLSVPFP